MQRKSSLYQVHPAGRHKTPIATPTVKSLMFVQKPDKIKRPAASPETKIQASRHIQFKQARKNKRQKKLRESSVGLAGINKKQILLIVALCLLTTRAAADESASKSVLSQIQAHCLHVPFKSENHPPGVVLDYIRGKQTPASCAEKDKKEQCAIERDIWEKFQKTESFSKVHPLLGFARNTAATNMHNWYTKLDKKIEPIKKALTKSEKELFDKYYDQIKQLRFAKLIKDLAIKFIKGNCGEHAHSDIYDVMELSAEKDVLIQAQRVSLYNDYSDHTYTNFFSVGPDVNIDNDPIKTKKFLEELHAGEGYDCDSWNSNSSNIGLFSKSKVNTNKLYREGWHSVKTHTFSLNFEFSKLPHRAAELLRRELFKIGLTNYPTKTLTAEAAEAEEVRLTMRR